MDDDNKIWEFIRNKDDISRAKAWIIAPGRNLDIRDENKTKYTPLMWAIQNNNVSVAKLLIDKGADINTTTPSGSSALLMATPRHLLDIAKLLIEKGANIEQQNDKGYTPIITSVLTANPVLAKLLIEKGADRTKRDKQGKTAIDYAKTEEFRNLLNSIEPAIQDAQTENPMPILNLSDPPPRLSNEYIEDQVSYISSLTPDEKKILVSYTKYGYKVINIALRGDTDSEMVEKLVKNFKAVNPLNNLNTLTPSTIENVRKNIIGGNIPEYVARFMTIVSKAPKLKEELTLYRGIESSLDLPAQGRQLLSTSLSPGRANAFVHRKGCCFLTMIVKPGVKTIWLESISLHEKEEEILLIPPFNLDIVRNSGGKFTITVSPTQYTRKSGTRRRKTHKARKTRKRIAFRK